MTDEEEREYLMNLRLGERVIETGESGMKGRTGSVCIGKHGVCVMWDCLPGETGRLTTSVTHGTRRVSDACQ